MKLFPLYHISPLPPKLFDSFLLKSPLLPLFFSRKNFRLPKKQRASVGADALHRKEVECPNLCIAMGIKTVFILPQPKKKRKARCAFLLLHPSALPLPSSGHHLFVCECGKRGNLGMGYWIRVQGGRVNEIITA